MAVLDCKLLHGTDAYSNSVHYRMQYNLITGASPLICGGRLVTHVLRSLVTDVFPSARFCAGTQRFVHPDGGGTAGGAASFDKNLGKLA
jgi:hypothetical protein